MQLTSTDFTAQTRETLISVEGASYEVDGKLVLSDVTFRSDAAKVGIVGRNGSGKSTLAKLLAGLIQPTEGTVTIDGIDPAKDRKAAIRTLGILFQNPDHQIIFPTVIEELVFGLRQLGQPKADSFDAAHGILKDFGKPHWADLPTHALSHGQKQLVCVMAIMAMRPKLLILDEPFAGLDIPMRLQLDRDLDKLPARRVHITHNPDDLRDFDEIVWLHDGKIASKGPPDVLLDLYREEMTRIGMLDDIADIAG